MTAPSPPHDNAYKHVFSHANAVRQLLNGFVHEDWVAQLDYSTLEKVSGSYVSDDLRDREDDIVWRIRMRKSPDSPGSQADPQGDWLYVYLLLEFQSSNDPYMAVRILTYIGLLYQDLIKSGYTRGLAANGKLPAVFPLVLYNGERTWTAERDIEQLIEPVPHSLAAYRPSLRYFLMDQGRLPPDSLDQPDNAVASLVQIERSSSPQEIAQLVGQLAEKLKSPQNRELRRAMTVWIRRLVLRRFEPAGHMPELDDLPEVHDMISERIDSWGEQIRQRALEQGKLEGKQEGEANSLRRLLVRRFGALPPEIEAHIHSASLDQIELWFDKAVDAANLALVFSPPAH